MKYCSSCKVSVNNPYVRCPLCYSALTSKDNIPEPLSYPNLAQKAAGYNLIFRLLLFISLTVAAVCATINLTTSGKISWSLIVLVNLTYMWAAIGTAVTRRAKLGYNITIQVVSLSALMIVLDRLAGHRNWALNYVVPLLLITATLSITIIIISKRMAMRDFILYLIVTATLGFVPIILLAAGVITVRWPAVTSAVYSGMSIVSLFIFADNATKIELKKRFHI